MGRTLINSEYDAFSQEEEKIHKLMRNDYGSLECDAV